MSDHAPTSRSFTTEQHEAYDIIEAIKNGQTDAIVSSKHILVLRLKEAEEALIKNEAEKKLVIDHTSELITAQDTEHNLLWANKAFLDAVGKSQSDIMGKKCYHLSQRSSPCPDCPTERALQSGTPQQSKVVAPALGQGPEHQRHWLIRALPIKDKAGQITGVVEFVRDITTQQRRDRLAAALAQIEALIHSAHDFDAMMQDVLAKGAAALHCETAAMSAKEGDRWTVKFVHGDTETIVGRKPEDIAGTVMDDTQESHARLALDSQKPVAISDVATDPRVNRSHLQDWQIRSVLVIPIITQQRGIGVVYFNYHTRPFQFTDEHVDFAKKMSASISLAASNIRRVNHFKSELAEQEQELRSKTELLDLAHDVIIIHDLDGKITFWNKGAEHLYGWKRDEVLGKTTHEVLKTRFREPMLKIISAVSTHGSWEGELHHRAKNGDRFIVESRWALQRDENDQPSSILIIERDITGHKHAEQQREDARRYAESIVDTVQEGLLVLDSRLKVVSANQAFYAFFNLRPEQVEGTSVYTLGQGQFDSPALRQLLGDILPKNSHFENFEMAYTSADGTSRTLMLNARRIHQESRKTDRILLAVNDITEQRQYEARIRHLTDELLSAEEEQRQNIAIALHDSVGQLLAFSKRELESLLKQPESRTDEVISSLLDATSKSLQETRSLTTDLSCPTLRTFGLAAAIEELAEHISDDHDLACRVDIPKALAPLEKKIELVFYRSVKELLYNTLKHAEANTVTICLRAEDDYLTATVTDDGKGFDTSRLSTDNLTKNSFGLFSLRERLTNIGGSFTIKSAKDKGTSVTLRTPLTILRSQ